MMSEKAKRHYDRYAEKVTAPADGDGAPKKPRQQKGSGLLIAGVVVAGVPGLVILLCAGGALVMWWAVAPTEFPEETENYAEARRKFRTKLIRQGPAPEAWQPETPPPGVEDVEFLSGELRLKAWVSQSGPNAARKPAVLFLHGYFAFREEYWNRAKPFRDAGFVVMTPKVRGENGLPGSYSMFYDEVEDVLAAADALAKMPHVDGKRIYLAGHSVGGTLTLLTAMTSNRFRAAASFSGSPDQVVWSRWASLQVQGQVVPFDPTDNREFQMRSPLAFPRSFKCPVRIYYGSQEFLFARSSQKTAELAKTANLDVEVVSVPGDHFTSVDPAMRQCIQFFQQK